MSFWDNETNDKDSFPTLRDGIYSAVLFNCEMDKTSKGDPVLKVQYKLNNNGRLFQQFTFSPTSAKWILWQMGVLGLNEIVKNKYGKTEEMQALCEQYYNEMSHLVGSTYVTGEVTNEEYKGKTYARFKLEDITDKTDFDSCEIKYTKSESSKAVLPQDNFGAAPSFDSNDEIPF